MNGQTIILSNPVARNQAHRLIDAAPDRAVMNVREAKRTNDQNSMMWALLSDVSRAKPMGRKLPPEHWKSLFMDECGHKPIWEPNLHGDGVTCLGYKSSRLSKADFSELIECILAYGSEHGVMWTEPVQAAA